MELSKIKTSGILFKANNEDIEKIVFDNINNHVTEKCDVGFIFGGTSMIPYRVDEGISLYKSDLINKLLVSGGIGFLNTDRKTPEAYKLRDYLIEHGIPERDIIVEDQSRNTVENIKNALEILSKEYNVYQTKFALITSDFHVRRCLGLFENILGNKDNLMGSAVMDGITDINSWTNSIYGKRLILTEAILLTHYAKQEKIKDQEIKGLTLNKKRNYR